MPFILELPDPCPARVSRKRGAELLALAGFETSAKGRVIKGRVAVGKSSLIQGMMQQVYHRELRVDPEAPGRNLLEREMRAFQYMSNGRFRKMEAKSGEHDDAVIAVSLACWLARRIDGREL